MDRHAFLDPPVLFRPIAFWSLNDRLDEDELVRQIDGMKAWIYDENGWPSGTCGSLIAGLDPAYRETHLFFAFDRIPHDEADVLWRRRYLTGRRRGRLWDAYRLDRPEPPREFVPDEGDDCPPDRRVLWIYVWRAPACNPRFGGKSYVDLMNPDAADAFFASTHQQYIDRFASDMGRDKLIPAVFFDDLTIKWDLMGAKGNAVPWTERMPALFADEYGYDLLGRLPDLFFDTPTAARTRADYIRLVTRLFADNFAGRIARRCEEYDLGVTGHLMGNEGLYSDAMLIYCYQRMPAVDHLSCGRGDFRKLRRIRSVADQFEKPATLCEAFAGAGHDMTPESQRRQTDYLCLGGVSTLVPHVAQYSMRGTRKFDHPPTFSDHDPWWRVNAPLADYQARLGCALYSARGAARVLVIDPIESKYIANAPGMGRENAVAKKLDRLTDRVERTLLGCHCEFAYGSEELLSRFGKTAGGRLCLG
ncbi:MAG: hypothetical protein J6X61_00070, partial [Clostridia bacterium]|nr:hypothetical protein [Clostridia bacterium]